MDVSTVLQQITPSPLPGEIAVRGIVKSLHFFPDRNRPTRVYGELTDAEQHGCISFSCPAGRAPELVGEPVVLQGRLQISTPGQQPGFKVQLVGHRLGSWLPSRFVSPEPFIPPPERRRIPLVQLVDSDSPLRPLLLGTATAIADALQQMGDAVTPLPLTKVVSTDLTRLQAEIAAAAPNHSALCLLRGGGDPALFAAFNHPELIKALLQTSLPFYIAAGHVTDLTLADKYADQSFSTPTAFGSAYLSACETRIRRTALQHRLAEAEAGLRDLKSQRRELYKTAQQKELGENIHLLAKAATQLRDLPEALKKQTQQVLAAHLDGGPQRLPTALSRPSRLRSWPAMLFFFLIGCLLGATACRIVLSGPHTWPPITDAPTTSSSPDPGQNTTSTTRLRNRRH